MFQTLDIDDASLQEESKFIFVPGPGDPGPGSVLPRPALPAYFTSDLRQLLPTAVFASNPCRLRLYTQQVVLFRSDLQNHMRRLCLIPPTSKLTVSAGSLSLLAHSTACQLDNLTGRDSTWHTCIHCVSELSSTRKQNSLQTVFAILGLQLCDLAERISSMYYMEKVLQHMSYLRLCSFYSHM